MAVLVLGGHIQRKSEGNTSCSRHFCNMEQLPDGLVRLGAGLGGKGFLPSFINLEISSSHGASDNEPACQCSRHRRHGLDPWVREDPLEEEMTTHSSILAWRIPWTEEPGR